MTPQERQAKLDEIKPFALIIGFLGNGKFDACVCISKNDYEKELKKFERYKVFDLTTPKVKQP